MFYPSPPPRRTRVASSVRQPVEEASARRSQLVATRRIFVMDADISAAVAASDVSRKLQEEELKSKALEVERAKLQEMLEAAQKQLEKSQKVAEAAKAKARTQKKSSACLLQ
jgi:hypothetical protein